MRPPSPPKATQFTSDSCHWQKSEPTPVRKSGCFFVAETRGFANRGKIGIFPRFLLAKPVPLPIFTAPSCAANQP